MSMVQKQWDIIAPKQFLSVVSVQCFNTALFLCCCCYCYKYFHNIREGSQNDEFMQINLHVFAHLGGFYQLRTLGDLDPTLGWQTDWM